MNRYGIAALIVVASIVGSTALAGGALGIYEPETHTPYSWPAGQANVYLDGGPLGILDNSMANLMSTEAWNQWNQVASSTFTGTIAGDFASIGLPADIDGLNFESVVGVWNGGGIHVIYDHDGSVMEAVVGSAYIYGVTIIEFVDDNSSDILEATIILNGSQIPTYYTPQEAMLRFGGVATHEFGHGAALAHSQTNGAILRGNENDPATWMPRLGPGSCDTPYTDGPGNEHIETMFPFISFWSTAEHMFTVDITDDISILSAIYPADGFENSPTVSGTLYANAMVGDDEGDDEGDDCSGDDDSSDSDCDGNSDMQWQGVNVIARNVDDPWRDSVSGQSGNWTQGMLGPDGWYNFPGLTEGANYIVYVDGLWAGAFSTPYHTLLPGPEEYHNADNESGNGITDAMCEWAMLAPTAGNVVDADVYFNAVEGAPTIYPIELPSSGVSDLTADGSVGVGSSGVGVFKWSLEDGVELIGGSYRALTPGISPDGEHIASEVFYPPEDYLQMAGYWVNGEDWAEVPDPGTVPCGDGNWTSAWGVADNQNITGLVWDTCGWTTAYTYNPTDGYVFLPQDPDGGQGSRGTDISGDGSTVVGWDKETNGWWRGTVWRDGVEEIVKSTPVYCYCDPEEDPDCEPEDQPGDAQAVNYDGSIVVGNYAPTIRTYFHPWFGEVTECVNEAWILETDDENPDDENPDDAPLAESLGEFFVGGYRPTPGSVNNDGSVVGGIAQGSSPWDPRYGGFWTEYTGWIDFEAFLAAQGTFAPGWVLISNTALSADGKTLGGWAFTPYSSSQGYVIDLSTVVMCAPDAIDPEIGHTVVVDFPHQMGCYLDHGAEIGFCESGGGALTDDEGGDGIFELCENWDDEGYDGIDPAVDSDLENLDDSINDERRVTFGTR